MSMRAGRRLPDLGPRGEGWFLLQLVILGAIAVAGTLGPAWSGAPRVAAAVFGAVLIGVGGILAVRGLVDLGGNLTPFPKPRDGAGLVQTGAYRVVRHPIYGGLILGGAGWGLLTASPASLAATAVLTAFFDLKSRREEAWLLDRFDGYARYRERTRRLLPWLY